MGASHVFATAGLVTVGLLVGSVGAARAQDAPPRSVDTQPAERALDALRRAWSDELDELTDIARSLAVADDTYEFVKRPNIPYVYDHYARARLAADRIDTVLIIDRTRKPLFWRSLRDSHSRGFPDAEAFLAQLPPFTPRDARGVPSLAGAARFARGPTLVVVMPIYATTGPGAARGWLIAARSLDEAQWHRYETLADADAEVLDPAESALAGDLEAALHHPLSPVLRVEATGIRGLMAVPDFNGQPFRVFSVLLARPIAAVASPAPVPAPASAPVGPNGLWFAVAAIVAGATAAALLRWRLAAPGTRVSVPPTDATVRGSIDSATTAAPVPRHASKVPAVSQPVAWAEPDSSEEPERVATPFVGADDSASVLSDLADTAATGAERLRARLTAINPVFRYQPQVDLRTGRVAGVEALLCISEAGKERPATEIVAEIEAAGLGCALAEHWLQEACRERRYWLRQAGHDFPVGVPVSQQTLEDPAFLPIVRRILAECELAPRLLELEVQEATLGGSAAALRALAEAHEAGISIAIDGFNAAQSNLRSLSVVPIGKLRVDPALVREIGIGNPEPALIDGIIGAALGLGIIVCATGVDTPHLMASTEWHGCTLAQGAELGPPVDGEQFLALVRGTGVDTARLVPIELDDALLQPAETGSG